MRKILIALTAVIVLQGCSKNPASGGISVVSSIGPLSYIANEVLKDRGSSLSLLADKQDAHSAEPRPLSLKAVESCDLLLILGSGLEFEEKNAPAAVKAAKRAVVLKMAVSMPPSGDPHIWVSLGNLRKMAEMITEKLSVLDSANSAFYASNLSSYSSRIDYISDRMRTAVDSSGIKRIFTDHTAFSYFASEMGLEQMELFEEGKEPSLADMERIMDGLEKDDSKILIITSASSKRYADIFAEEASARVFIFNPLADDVAGEFLKLADFINEDR